MRAAGAMRAVAGARMTLAAPSSCTTTSRAALASVVQGGLSFSQPRRAMSAGSKGDVVLLYRYVAVVIWTRACYAICIFKQQ